MTKAQSSEKSDDETKKIEHNGMQERVYCYHGSDRSKLVQEGMQINRQRSKQRVTWRYASSVNPIYKLILCPKPVRIWEISPT